ncbi:hypothetical protein HNY73_011419 [Argiope bruennichi]|uniref:Uncharacterized protein n=1 Tax=Argiope bruennichi TaxID=94029 RepID=A0A8T0F695_ARGBR|nr:hypothetical protein HNY73_011419 [Argiope bruennichi]
MASNMSDIRQKMVKSKISNAQDKAVVKYFPLKMVKDKKTETFMTRQALEICNNLLLIDSTVPNSDLNKYYIAFASKMQYIVLVVPPVVMNTSDCSKVWPEDSLAASFRDEAEKVIQTTNMFQHLLGYIISPDMIAARVRLTHAQKDLWEREEEMDVTTFEISRIQPPGPWKLFEDSKIELPDIDLKSLSTKSQQSFYNAEQTIHESLQTIHHSAKGRACHIVLGKSSDAKTTSC